jgi:peptidoglycan/LPS O-acetylase OafA/YrhL
MEITLLKDPLKKKPEFFAINGLRFLAASWVLFFHISIHFGELVELKWIQPILNQGVLAMTLFFMLSGFILSYRYVSFDSDQIKHYISARIARLYPVYIFMGIITIWRLGAGASSFFLVENYGYLGAMPFALFVVFLFVFGLQAWFPNLFGIWNFGGSWSLSVEAFFYSLFPKLRQAIGGLSDRILVLLVFIMPAIMGVITLGLVVSHKASFDTSKLFYVLPIFRLPEFVLGICGYVLFVERKLYQKKLLIFGLLSFCLLLTGIYTRNLPGLIDWNCVAAVAFLAIFVACLKVEAPSFVKRCINYSGRISYCVYISQFTTIPILKKFQGISLEQQWFIAIASTMLMAIVTYHLVEVLAYSKTRSYSLSILDKIFSVLRIKT